MSIPPVTRQFSLWSLGDAFPHDIWRAGGRWRGLAASVRAAADDVNAGAGRLQGEAWTGEAAEAFHDHRIWLTRECYRWADVADALALVCDDTAGSIEGTLSRLSDNLDWIRAACPPDEVMGDRVTFRPRDESELAHVNAGIAEADRIRQELDERLAVYQGRLESYQAEMRTIAGALQEATGNDFRGFDQHAGSALRAGVIFDPEGEWAVVSAGSDRSDVKVTVDPATGERVVEVFEIINGEWLPAGVFRIPAEVELRIHGGSGDNRIDVSDAPGVTVVAGRGSDWVGTSGGYNRVVGNAGDDTVRGGGGPSFVSGGAGDDSISNAGSQNIVFAGSGDDAVRGGEDNDYLFGGDGHDTLNGERGLDTIDGGDGGDAISGGGDSDTIVGGSGADFIHAGDRGSDTIDPGVEVTVRDVISPDGNPVFEPHVENELNNGEVVVQPPRR